MNDEKLDITVIVLTYNEKLHIERCLKSINTFAKSVIVVDSFSTDGTQEIAKNHGAIVLENAFINYSIQFNWALRNSPIETEWVMRLDADEYLEINLIEELKKSLGLIPKGINGIVFKRKHIFLGKPIIKGVYPVKLMRLFRNGSAACEDRWMDEHMELSYGSVIELENDFVDHNLNNISWWVQKHNSYAVREAIDLLNLEIPLIYSANQNGELSEQAKLKRQKKLKYARLPLFWRAFFYFLYRYFIKLGFLDGKEGFLWNFLQGWWYRTLVDAKIFEIKKHCGNDPHKIKKYLFDNHNISL
jgi:glycosyltransferase involved in cell wall biosynthesis